MLKIIYKKKMVLTRENKQLFVKITVIVILFLLWLIYRLVILSPDPIGYVSKLYCFKDVLILDVFNGLTRFLAYDLQYRDYFLIFGSNLLDITFLFVTTHYVLYGNGSKLIVTLGIFYPLRALTQLFFLYESYDMSTLFNFPGFYSLTVPLHPGVDYFFSGHVGSTSICMLYFREYFKEKLFKYIGTVIVIFQAFLMLAIRGHYFIDLVFGYVIAHYVYIHAHYLSEWLDSKFAIFAPKKETKPETKKDARDVSLTDHLSLIVVDKTDKAMIN